ncbi:MAG: hypothetical protein ACJASL_003472 [Paraglaciecola sp.]|jgi:hypothetical protein
MSFYKTPAKAGVLFCMAGYVLIVWPGLYGGFILDDWPNLAPLSNIEIQGFWAVVFEGVSSTLGRPVSLISFAIQAESWPNNPLVFKQLNLVIHIINAGLVFLVSRELYQIYFPSSRLQSYFAVSVCVFWLYLPLHASTIFYVVQRMTMLSAMFVLVGVWGWLWGVRFYDEGRPKLGVGLATVFVSFGYVAGVLSKESAILLGVFMMLSIILFNYRGVALPFLWKVWLIVFAVIPTLALVVYLTIGDRYMSGYGIRHFTPYERILTELRILWDYAFKIYFPLNSSLNIFNDGFPVSKSLLNPMSTLLALLGWVAASVLAIIKRKQWPFFAFGLFWFLGGHILESTIVGLELYFEHRNYLPSLGLVILVLGTAFQWLENSFRKGGAPSTLKQFIKKKEVVLFVSISVLWLCWFGVVLAGESKSWSSPYEMAIASLQERPNSLRATQDAAAFFANIGDYPQSAMILHHIDQKWPGYPGTLVQKVMLNCYAPNVLLPQKTQIVQRLRYGLMDRGAVPTLNEILNIKKTGGCTHIGWSDYRDYLQALAINEKFAGQRENISVLLAYSYNAESQFQVAADVLDTYTTTHSSLGYRLLKAQFWAMAGDVNKAKGIVSNIRALYKIGSRDWLLHSEKIDMLEQLLNQSKNSDK